MRSMMTIKKQKGGGRLNRASRPTPYTLTDDFRRGSKPLTEKQILADIMNNVPINFNYIEAHKDALMSDKDRFRPYFIRDARAAYFFAHYIDACPRDDTREATLSDAYWANRYAQYVDRKPRDDTRKAASRDPEEAYEYAMEIDNGPHDITRKGCCKDPRYACDYAINIDKKIHKETLHAVADTLMEKIYVESVPGVWDYLRGKLMEMV